MLPGLDGEIPSRGPTALPPLLTPSPLSHNPPFFDFGRPRTREACRREAFSWPFLLVRNLSHKYGATGKQTFIPAANNRCGVFNLTKQDETEEKQKRRRNRSRWPRLHPCRCTVDPRLTSQVNIILLCITSHSSYRPMNTPGCQGLATVDSQ